MMLSFLTFSSLPNCALYVKEKGGSPPRIILWGERLIQQRKPTLSVRGMLTSMTAVRPPSSFHIYKRQNMSYKLWTTNSPRCLSGFAVGWYFIITFVTQKASMLLNKKPFKILHRTFYGIYMVISVFISSFLQLSDMCRRKLVSLWDPSNCKWLETLISMSQPSQGPCIHAVMCWFLRTGISPTGRRNYFHLFLHSMTWNVSEKQYTFSRFTQPK